MFPLLEHARYLYRFDTGPKGSQWDRSYQWQVRFLLQLRSMGQQKIKFRGPNFSYDQGGEQRIKEVLPDACWSDRKDKFTDEILRSRIVVIDHFQTSALEAFLANLPTIIFFDPDLWCMRKSAKPYIQELKDAGVIWHQPEEAANHVAKVYEHPDDWWFSSNVQKARTEFANKFCSYSKDGISTFIQSLLS